jgi:hypothetical protein
MAESFPENCIFCDKPTPYKVVKETGGNMLYYGCKEDDCGDYIISKRAISWIEQDKEFKLRGSAMARKYRDTEGILKITYDAEKDEAIPSHILRAKVNW